ncbi:hypothetical protein M758_3G002500 [Ceratodon purpureus]|nr:hypothetical protein M758_3G002500 [Ceratodon purpureus]KAG0621222.1 hypothetical protein M758_3G002500 [Ceratodon purpureus]
MGRFERDLRGVLRCGTWVIVAGCLLLWAVMMVSGVSDNPDLESVNMTAGGVAWVTTLDVDELEKSSEKGAPVEQVEAGEGFNSMESILHWAIGHSDPEKLKVAATVAKRLSAEELENRRQDIKELMDRLHIPSDAELMKIAIADLNNLTLSTDDRQRALQELLILVEPIDNANDVADLDKLGGLQSIIAELDRPEEELRTTAAWVLGKACQNNLVVQKQILQHKGLPRLMEMVEASSSEEAVKALYAVSAVVRNFPLAQEEFYFEGGAGLMERLFAGPSVDIRLRRKSLFLLADLAEQSQQLRGGQLDAVLKASSNVPDSVNLFNERLLKAVVNLMEASDMDTQEKALMAVRSLSKVSDSVRNTLVVACRVEVTLERLKSQLHELQEHEDQADFARDLEVLRQEVLISISKSEPSNAESLKDEL